MSLSNKEQNWFYDQIEKYDPEGKVVTINRENKSLQYNDSINSDEVKLKKATDEELVKALCLCILSTTYQYETKSFYIEKYYHHGHPGSMRDEVDLIIYDDENQPFALWEFKSPEEYDKDAEKYIRYQLFGTAPLVGAVKLLVYATIRPKGDKPSLVIKCINREIYQSYEGWKEDGSQIIPDFPKMYLDISHKPFTRGGEPDLRVNSSQADFRAIATTLHNEFFGEHPDNVIFSNILKCILAKIYDERQSKRGDEYSFQIFYKNGKEESSEDIFKRINKIYETAYTRYIEPTARKPDEINVKEFSPDKVKFIVKLMQSMSITQGAALHGDIIGAFFEEILRIGFKQDKGMYFTHSNLVWFILEAIDLEGLAIKTWENSTHPENRLPYVIDPACGSGTFLLRTMEIITKAIKSREQELVTDQESIQFYNARLSDSMPNYWAENFIYGIDPKFIMAITAKINMVLHGDGSAHIFKYDSLKAFSSYRDNKLKPISDPYRSVSNSKYKHEMVESFDVVVSNPPFGIKLSADTKNSLPLNFETSDTSSSECIFLERWFQLLKPYGRLGVVIPESLLNTADNVETRLFLYRMFWIRTIVSLPRNLFIDTPTLVSLLFAQKKSKEEIEAWDKEWDIVTSEINQKILEIKQYLGKKTHSNDVKLIQKEFITRLSPIIQEDSLITKKGYSPVSVLLPAEISTVKEACEYYRNLIKLAGFKLLLRNQIFSQVVEKMDYDYPVYTVDEVGYKLSKRKEKIRPNQLCKLIGVNSKTEIQNLHLCNEQAMVQIEINNPERVVDYIRRDVKWI